MDASEVIGDAAKKGIFYVEEGDPLLMILSGVRRFAKYATSGLLQAKKTLTQAVSEGEEYLF